MAAIATVALYAVSAAIALRLAATVNRFTRAAALVLFLLPLTLTGTAMFTGRVYGPIDLPYSWEPLGSVAHRVGVESVANPGLTDTAMEFVPWHDALRRSIAAGEWPLWNPYELAGTPLAGASQVAPYHPITVAGLLLPLPHFLTFAAAMLYLLCAVSAFLFARDLGASDGAALFAAAAWMASTHIVMFALTAMSNAFSVMPLVLLGARRIARVTGRGSFALLTTSLVLLVLSGHPETALHVVALGTAWFAAEMFATRWRQWRRPVAGGLASGIAALFLTAFFLLPHLQVIGQSEELRHRAGGPKRKSSTPAQMAHLLAAQFPFIEGSVGHAAHKHPPETEHGWMPTIYAGALVIPLAAVGLLAPRRVRWLLLAMLLWGVATAIVMPGVNDLLVRTPGFDIAVNERMAGFAVLASAALAALGIDDLHRRRRLAVFALAAMTVAVIVAASFAPADLPRDFVAAGVSRAAVPLVLAMFAVASLRPQHASTALLAILLLQRAGETSAMHPAVRPEALSPHFPGLELMRSNEPSRFVATGQIMPPALSTLYGLEDVRGFQAVTLSRFVETWELWCVPQPVWFNRVDDLRSSFLSLMNVRYALVPHGIEIPPWWSRKGEFQNYDVVENTRVLPRAFVPARVHHVMYSEDAIALAKRTEDFSADSAIESREEVRIEPNGPGTVSMRGRGGRVSFRAQMANAGWVVVTNAASKGWRAYDSNGKNIPLKIANTAFLAFKLPAGTHNVDLVYRPKSFVHGALISSITLIALIGTAVLRRR